MREITQEALDHIPDPVAALAREKWIAEGRALSAIRSNTSPGITQLDFSIDIQSDLYILVVRNRYISAV
jgi:hypothetical protein